MKTLQEQAHEAVQLLPDEKLPDLIQYAYFLRYAPNFKDYTQKVSEGKPLRQAGRLKGQVWMSDDFNDPMDF